MNCSHDQLIAVKSDKDNILEWSVTTIKDKDKELLFKHDRIYQCLNCGAKILILSTVDIDNDKL